MVELRLAPDDTVYVINLTAAEAERVLDITENNTAKTEFEASVSCIGAAVCQVGVRDSQSLLRACVEAAQKAGLPADALPKIHISGCPSSGILSFVLFFLLVLLCAPVPSDSIAGPPRYHRFHSLHIEPGKPRRVFPSPAQVIYWQLAACT